MAQSGYSVLSLYYSTTASAAPTAGNLVAGELAINTNDGVLYYKDSSGVVQKIGTKNGVGTSTTTQVLYNSSGSLAGSANMTFDGTKLTLANDASISGLTVGKGGGAGSNNTVAGYQAGTANASSGILTAFGYASGYSSTSGQSTFVGWNTGYANTTGSNTAVGQQAFYSNTTGTSNNAMGQAALYANTTGGSNVAIGDNALRYNTTASYNTAVGYQAGYSNTTGQASTFVGYKAGYGNTTATNTGIGYQALLNTTAGSNTGIGTQALQANTTGTFNSSLGEVSLLNNTTGSYNTALGGYALQANTTASNNTAVGYQAGYSNTTSINNSYFGYQAAYNATSQQNTIIGSSAGYGITATGGITIMGYQAGYSAVGTGSTLIGYTAGYSSTGSQNTFVGSYNGTNSCGYSMTTGSKNSIFGGFNGNQGGLDIRTASNYIVLSDGDGNPRGIFDASGNFIVGRTSSQGRISAERDNADWCYNSNQTGTGTKNHFRFLDNGTVVGTITSSGSTTSYNTSSDYRLKEDVAPMTGALEKVLVLKPVTYKWKIDGANGQGFIAHELQEVFPEAVTGVKDALDKDGKMLPQGIDTSHLIATLTAAIQELNAKVTALESQLGAK